MSEWLTHLSNSFADQAGAWFIGTILALLGVFSGRLVETIKFALNRADLRTKYYEEMAIDISHYVFLAELYTKYSLSKWADKEWKGGLASEYDELMNNIRQKEYVYLSWLHRYWGEKKAHTFVLTMDKIKAVDEAIIRFNESGDEKAKSAQLESAFRSLEKAVHVLLVTDS